MSHYVNWDTFNPRGFELAVASDCQNYIVDWVIPNQYKLPSNDPINSGYIIYRLL